jgi:hypothetical protein
LRCEDLGEDRSEVVTRRRRRRPRAIATFWASSAIRTAGGRGPRHGADQLLRVESEVAVSDHAGVTFSWGAYRAENSDWEGEKIRAQEDRSACSRSSIRPMLVACGRDPVGTFDNMAQACESVAPGTLPVGSLTKPEAGVIYCARHDDMDAITSGEVGAEDVAAAVVKLAENGKWYVTSS